MTTELGAKRLQLLKETIPDLARIAILWHEYAPISRKILNDIKAAAPSLSIEVEIVKVQTSEQFSAAFAEITRARVQALYLIESPLFYGYRKTLAELALKARLPAIYGTRSFPEDGGLMSYGADMLDQSRRAAGYVDRILKGAKASDLPIEQANKVGLVINLKTAKALGITIPESILVRADEVIQ